MFGGSRARVASEPRPSPIGARSSPALFLEMGKITVFSVDLCPYCKRVKELLAVKGATLNEISLTSKPEWRHYLFLLSNGRYTVPQVFFGDRLIGGCEELERLDQLGELDQLIQQCVDDSDTDFPPPYRRPHSKEFLKLIPSELRIKWQADLESVNSKVCASEATKQISSLLIMLETPEEMVVLCSAGDPGTSEFPIGLGGIKGDEGSDRKSYCQVVVEKNETLFFDGPEKRFRELKNCNDWVKFGYGYYIGAPWSAKQLRGTVVAMEKKEGILKEDHKGIIETLRDQLEQDLSDHYKKLEVVNSQ